MNTSDTTTTASGLFRQPQHNRENKLIIPHENGIAPTTTASAQPKTRTKAEIKAERLSWAIWAAGVYKREHHLPTYGEFYESL